MFPSIDETHDPALASWVSSANEIGTDFPIQNLPFGIFHSVKGDGAPRACVAIGSSILDLSACREEGAFEGIAAEAAKRCSASVLNDLMALGPDHRVALRKRLSGLLRNDSPESRKHRASLERCLLPISSVVMHLPVRVGDYTDFYASIHHATNLGSMFRPDNPLLPNYKYIPVGYHGRASSIVLSGTDVIRPAGQSKDDAAPEPSFGPSKALDYELEVGCFIGTGNKPGEPIPIAECEEHLFGICLVNDWSARDIQRWEYQPLGPFLGKNFATSISPWVVTMEALAPFRAPEFSRSGQDPKPLPYLSDPANSAQGGLDIILEVSISTGKMRAEHMEPHFLSRGNAKEMYWTFAQMLAHHTCNGCNMQPGDLIASGTISGNTKDSRGSMIELSWRGTEPLTLPSGETRKFLQDGDEITFRGYCQRNGFRRIGMGECRGKIVTNGRWKMENNGGKWQAARKKENKKKRKQEKKKTRKQETKDKKQETRKKTITDNNHLK